MELQELRDYAATHIMGWTKKSNGAIDYWYNNPEWKILYNQWKPDSLLIPQIWMVVHKMQELGFRFEFFMGYIGPFTASFASGNVYLRSEDYNPYLAILKAAVKAVRTSHGTV